MSEIAETGHRPTAISVVQESYAFACMRCGHGWEQSYDIEHHIDGKGHEFVMYMADGARVPSPLTRPTCLNCGGHVVRIMRAGQVSSVASALDAFHHRRPVPRAARPQEPEAAAEGADDGAQGAGRQHHWHLSDLLHPFQHHRKDG